MDSKLTVGQVEYPLAFTVEAAEAVDKRFGGIEKIGDFFNGDNLMENISGIMDLMCIVANAGAEKARITTGEEIPPLEVETLKKVFDVVEIQDKFSLVIQAITNGTKRTVEGEAKNTAGE